MIAESEYASDRFDRAIEAIHGLIEERGIRRYALFGEVNEGTIFPDGTEAMSGHVIDEHGSVYAFWTGWDDERQQPAFVTWREALPEPCWLTNDEYLTARAAVGLDRPISRPV